MPSNFSLPDYLARIGYAQTPQTDIKTLKELMVCQLYTIPFENADVWKYRKTVSLDTADIFEKLVHKKRGGYCYELNGLFCMALEQLGFAYEMLGVRPRFNYHRRRPKTHMAILVHIGDKQYICDLGFGGYGIREPVDLSILDTDIEQNGDIFKLKKEDKEYVLQVKLEHGFADLYSFDTYPFEWVDYETANYFNSNSPDTIFTNKRLAIAQKADGRVFLIDSELKIIRNGEATKTHIDEADYETVLKEYFNIELS